MRLNRPNHLQDVISPATETVDGLAVESAHLVFHDHLGRRCEVFASRAFPDTDTPAPVVVHCPGGGQTIKTGDLKLLAQYGFAAVSFDWQIGAAKSPRASRWPEGVVSQKSYFTDFDHVVLPLAVQAAGVCIDWMQADPRCDRDNVGVTGISWGGYLSWVVNACEPRIRAAVPVYGCGGIFEPEIEYMLQWNVPDAMQRVWQAKWDPASLVDQQIAPVCFLSATNDFFGWHTFANQMLDRLPPSRRRSVNPNNSHHLDPCDAATGLAFLKHHLAGGDPLPPEPLLDVDLHVDLCGASDVDDVTIWWTPSVGVDPHRCWIPGLPENRNRIQQAFARVRYKSGLSLNSPLRQFDRRDADREAAEKSRDETPTPDVWPDALAGLAISPGLSTTQYWGQLCHAAHDEVDPSKVVFTPTDTPANSFGVTLMQPADPAWNDGSLKGVSVDFEFEGDAPATMQIAIRRKNQQNNCGSGELPLEQVGQNAYRLTIHLEAMQNAPADLRWVDVRLITLVGRIPLKRRIVMGPIVRLK